jgi:cobalt-zinc-cadmium efflux system outer membrane protein
VIATDREAAFDGWTAFFELIAAREAAQLAAAFEALSARVNDATRAAAEKGLIPMIDSDVAEATFLRVVQARVLAEQTSRHANNTLATLLGQRPEDPIAVEGELEPLRLDTVDALASESLVAKLPEVQALEASQRSLHARADYYRRARWPNPTFSVIAQNDETNHFLLGLGLALPIVLPQPVGHTYAGEIDESVALADKLGAQSDQARRDARSELSAALETYQTSKQLRELYSQPLLARAEQSLHSIASEIEAGRLAARDVILAQQALMDELRASIDAKLALCLASVRLAKASGVALEQGGPR